MPNVAEIIKDHVTLEVRCLDRLYLNAYIPRLQSSGGVIDFLVRACRQKIASPAIFGHLTDAFKTRLRQWATAHQVPWIQPTLPTGSPHPPSNSASRASRRCSMRCVLFSGPHGLTQAAGFDTLFMGVV